NPCPPRTTIVPHSLPGNGEGTAAGPSVSTSDFCSLSRASRLVLDAFTSQLNGPNVEHRRDVNNFMLTVAFAVLAAIVGGGIVPARAAEIAWRRLGDEAADVLSDAIRIDTQNPPGGETAAANALARKLDADGIPADVIESAPGRGNVHARLAGSGRGRPII